MTVSALSLKRRSSSGFALVSTLAILVIVTILLVAFATVMRTERSASQNFADRSRAEAIGMGMINRILAEHAAPVGDRTTGAPVKPFEVDSKTGLPTKEASDDYFAATGWSATTGPDVPIDFDRDLLEPIYRMVPDDVDEFELNGLIRTSKPAGGGGTPAYSEEFWAYGGLTNKVLGSRDAEPETVPQWVDYYQPDDPSTPEDESEYPVAQVAFAIWDEGGKFDVNMVGEDISVNGIAPHDLKIEEEITGDDGRRLFEYLNNQDGNGQRDRSNFSLRRVVSDFHPTSGTNLPNDQGDDRWIFSVRELIQRKLIDPTKFRMVTTNSRDFDVRPEWDADRAPRALRKPGSTLGAEDFLRSYINNPALFGLFYGAGGVGPSLVWTNLNNEELKSQLVPSLQPSPTVAENEADWMQVMRLLAVLRRALPGWGLTPDPPDPWHPLDLTSWTSSDIWGIGQNLIQASSQASDHNLVAYNPSATKWANRDPLTRVGVRISPYIVETALKIKKVTGGYTITPYIKLWNPYPFRLNKPNGDPIRYRVGFYTGAVWPNTTGGGNNDYGGFAGTGHQNSRAEGITAPEPGNFKVIRFPPLSVTGANVATFERTSPLPPPIRMRPYLQDMEYPAGFHNQTPDHESPYICIELAGFTIPLASATAIREDADQLYVVFDRTNFPYPTDADGVLWYSFQIDDPRIGSIHRNSPGMPDTPAPIHPDPSLAEHKWSWILYKGQHALPGKPFFSTTNGQVPDDDMAKPEFYRGKTFNGVSGYNQNFGANWPGVGGDGLSATDTETFAKMMATFALPGRPLLNIGEIGTVFAFRPWVTLNFANKIIPDAVEGASDLIDLPSTNKALLRPAAILDYFTTIGTPESINYDLPNREELQYLNKYDEPPLKGSVTSATFLNKDKRYQDKTWLFEALEASSTVDRQIPDGNLRPIRGRINLNTASTEVLTALLKAPYRMPASIGLKLAFNDPPRVNSGNPASDYIIEIDEADARAMAEVITLPVTHGQAIRPLRMLSDLSQLYDKNPTLMKDLYEKYPQSVISAMIGRLAQFGTVRQQAYTIDMVVRTLNPAAERNRGSGDKRVITGEARLQARVFFDSFSRQAFIESVEYK